jgi:hypothetical protein
LVRYLVVVQPLQSLVATVKAIGNSSPAEGVAFFLTGEVEHFWSRP